MFFSVEKLQHFGCLVLIPRFAQNVMIDIDCRIGTDNERIIRSRIRAVKSLSEGHALRIRDWQFPGIRGLVDISGQALKFGNDPRKHLLPPRRS